MLSRPLLTVALLLLVTSPASAQAAAVDTDSGVSVGFEAGVDVVNAYVFRGVVDDDGSPIVQPWGQLSLGVLSASDGAIRSLDIHAIVFSSIHASGLGATRGPAFLYEIESRLAVSLELAHAIELALHYALDTSPNGAFDPVHRLQLHGAVRFGPTDGAWWVVPRLEIAVPVASLSSAYLYTGTGLEIGHTIWHDGPHRLVGSLPLQIGFTVVGADEGGLGPATEPRYRFSRAGVALAFETESDGATLGARAGLEVHHTSGLLARGLGQRQGAHVVIRAAVTAGL